MSIIFLYFLKNFSAFRFSLFKILNILNDQLHGTVHSKDAAVDAANQKVEEGKQAVQDKANEINDAAKQKVQETKDAAKQKANDAIDNAAKDVKKGLGL